jgi:hydrogenase expression/formation protein HypE
MSEMPEIGKISPEIFQELIFPRLGASNKNVIVGPQHGVDVGIVRVGDKAMSVTTDPVFIVPEYGWERAAWFAIHIIASDSVTSGLKPTYLSIDLGFSDERTETDLSFNRFEPPHGDDQRAARHHVVDNPPGMPENGD